MPDSEDVLRTALREYASLAGPPRFTAEPLIRKVIRRRARFTAASGLCALAVAAAALAVPVALRGQPGPGPGPGGHGPSGPPTAAATGPWKSEFICGQEMPSGLPGASGDGLRITIDSVTRSASGEPAVRWSVHGSGTVVGAITPGLLIVGGRWIFAAKLAGAPVETGIAPPPAVTVPSGQVHRYAPLLDEGTSGSWDSMWRQHQAYRVVIVATVWVWPEHGKSPVPVRLSVAAPLPAG